MTVRTLEQGYVPTAPIIAQIDRRLHIEGEWSQDHDQLQPLATLFNMDDLRKMFVKKGWVRFDLADTILCKLNLVDLWWGPLSEIYLGVNLGAKYKGGARLNPARLGGQECALDGCSVMFEPGIPQGGGKSQRYCTPRCRSAASNLRRKVLAA